MTGLFAARAVFSSDHPVPDFLEPAATATLEADGARTQPRTYLRTRRGDYLDRDFTFDVVFVNDRDRAIMFVGVSKQPFDNKKIGYMTVKGTHLFFGSGGLYPRVRITD